MESLPCPLCRESLEPTQSHHGLVWVCRACRAGAVTLPILRQVASRPFVNQLWQAALHHGRPSTVVCPACRLPFTEFMGMSAAVNPQLKVCVRCFWVWLYPGALSTLSAADLLLPARGIGRDFVQEEIQGEATAAAEACHGLSSLAVQVLCRVL